MSDLPSFTSRNVGLDRVAINLPHSHLLHHVMVPYDVGDHFRANFLFYLSVMLKADPS